MKISRKKTARLVAFVFFLSTFTLFVSYFTGTNQVLSQEGTMSGPTEGTMSGPTEGTMSKPTEGTMSGPTGNSGEIKLTNPFSKGDNLYQFIQAVVSDILLPIGGVVAVIAIIYSGFKLVTARGNETKLEEAKRAFLYTTIGVAILLGAWTIAKVIEKTITQITN